MFPTHLNLLSGKQADRISINNFCNSFLHSSPQFSGQKKLQARSGFCTPSAGPLSYSYSDASVHAGDKLNQLSKFCTVYISLRLTPPAARAGTCAGVSGRMLIIPLLCLLLVTLCIGSPRCPHLSSLVSKHHVLFL